MQNARGQRLKPGSNKAISEMYLKLIHTLRMYVNMVVKICIRVFKARELNWPFGRYRLPYLLRQSIAWHI